MSAGFTQTFCDLSCSLFASLEVKPPPPNLSHNRTAITFLPALTKFLGIVYSRYTAQAVEIRVGVVSNSKDALVLVALPSPQWKLTVGSVCVLNSALKFAFPKYLPFNAATVESAWESAWVLVLAGEEAYLKLEFECFPSGTRRRCRRFRARWSCLLTYTTCSFSMTSQISPPKILESPEYLRGRSRCFLS